MAKAKPVETYHLANSDFLDHVGSPSKAKVGDIITLPSGLRGFEGPACRGEWNVRIPAGKYVITSRKSFRGGTQEIVPAT